MFKTLATATALTLTVGTAQAALLNFESQGYVGDKVALGTDEAFGGFDVTFESANGLFAIKSGGPGDAFVPNDTTNPAGQFGDYFLSSNFGKKTELSITYGTAVSAASFEVADIDGSGTNLEEFTFTAFDALNTVLKTLTVTGNDTTLDGEVTAIGFSNLGGLIQRIEIVGTTAGGTRDIGIAFDNFNTTVDVTTPIPLPAGLPLAAAALGALGLLRARRKG